MHSEMVPKLWPISVTFFRIQREKEKGEKSFSFFFFSKLYLMTFINSIVINCYNFYFLFLPFITIKLTCINVFINPMTVNIWTEIVSRPDIITACKPNRRLSESQHKADLMWQSSISSFKQYLERVMNSMYISIY